MNHSFVAAAWSIKICAKCTKPESAHGDEVQCESCSNIGPVEVVGKILMCAECQTRDTSTVKVTKLDEHKLSIEQVVNQVDRLLETDQIKTMNGDSIKSIIDEAIRGNIKEYKDYFNAAMPSILDLEALINADDSIEQKDKRYALAIALRKRINYLAQVLFQFQSGKLQAAGEVKSIQEYMSKLIPDLRIALRAEFAANTPNYTPQTIKTNVPKERKTKQSTEDKLAESYAKMMKIPIEQAKRLLANKLRDECVCATTPGMCKVHNS